MIAIPIQIVRWVDDDQPGFVECQFVDAHGKCWRFIEKLPVISTLDLSKESQYPQPGVIACEVKEIVGKLAVVDTTLPWGVESTEGTTRFEVLAETLIDHQ